jgi:hypothetical protein
MAGVELIPAARSEHAQRHARREQGKDEQYDRHDADGGAPLPVGQVGRDRDERAGTREGKEQR